VRGIDGMVVRIFGRKGSKQNPDGKYEGRVGKIQEDGQTLIRKIQEKSKRKRIHLG